MEFDQDYQENQAQITQQAPKFMVTCWRNQEEFQDTYDLIFGIKSTTETRQKALQRLIIWKIRRCQETPTTILSTITLLEVLVKDEAKTITDKSTLSTLYANSITKFLNYMTTLQLHENTMYKSAKNLKIDSFIVDLRHLVAHGQETPSLEVFQKSAKYCLDWLKTFYWDREIDNISPATIREIIKDSALEFEEMVLKDLVLFDIFLEANHKNYHSVDDLNSSSCSIDPERKNLMMKYLEGKRQTRFRGTLATFSKILIRHVETRKMRLNASTFFEILTKNCDYFMSVDEKSNLVEIADVAEDSDEPEVLTANDGHKKQSIISLTQNFIFALVKHDHLSTFLDYLFPIYNDKISTSSKKNSARFWILTLLKSFNYYRQYCELFENLQEVFMKRNVDSSIQDIYTKKLKADLREVFVFVGTQILPTTLKFPLQFLEDNMKNLDEGNKEICLGLIPLVHPPLNNNEEATIKDLINILTARSSKLKNPNADEVHTVNDLKKALGMIEDVEMEQAGESEKIWTLARDDIDWSTCPIGMEIF